MDRINSEYELREHIKDLPGNVLLEILQLHSDDGGYQGLLVNAPKDKKYIIEIHDIWDRTGEVSPFGDISPGKYKYYQAYWMNQIKYWQAIRKEWEEVFDE